VTPGKRWRFRRNAVIYLAHREGVSQRVLSDVFDMARSRIQAIVAEMAAEGDHWKEAGMAHCSVNRPTFLRSARRGESGRV
jgi:hypothetical protein